MDIVEFAENVCDVKLHEFQKRFLREMYNKRKTNKELVVARGRSTSKLLGYVMLCTFYDEFITESKEEKSACDKG